MQRCLKSKVCLESGLVGNIVASENKHEPGKPEIIMSLYNHEPLQQTDRLYRRLNGLETIQAVDEGTGPRQRSARPSGKGCFNFIPHKLVAIAQGMFNFHYSVLQVALQAS